MDKKRPVISPRIKNYLVFSTGMDIPAIIFYGMYAIIFISLTILKKYFAPGAIPWADALASATAYTGMWLMAKKKVESWHWWIATNAVSIPLYFVKDYVFTSVFYFILLIMAFWGLAAWRKKVASVAF